MDIVDLEYLPAPEIPVTEAANDTAPPGPADTTRRAG